MQPPSDGSEELNALVNGETMASCGMALIPFVSFPSMVWNKQVRKHADVRFTASFAEHSSFQHPGRT
jgi:hypothetical protein